MLTCVEPLPVEEREEPFEGAHPSEFQSEEQFYRTLVEHTLDITTVVDADGLIAFNSPSIERVLGYGRDELVGRRVFEFVHPDDAAQVREGYERAVRRETPSSPIEYRCRHKDGRWMMLESVGRYCRDLAGRPMGIVNSRDVSDRKLLEAQYLRAQRMEVVGRMTGAIAHDFNNMLGVILGHADLLLRDSAEARVHSSATAVKKMAESASALTRQLLTFARHGTAAAPATSHAVDANYVVAELTGIFERLVGKRVRLTCALGAAQPIVAIDRAHLDQILINLVVNARDAMPEGGTVTVSTRDGAGPADGHSGSALRHVVIEVADTGTGMTPDVRARIFEPFFTTKAPGRGSGLGLATVHSIVQQAGGRIEVETVRGRGTTFRIRLRERDVAPATIAASRHSQRFQS